jgi:cytochrome oxidase Cu insertion factor (SCO1/SenC/PrrC family)
MFLRGCLTLWIAISAAAPAADHGFGPVSPVALPEMMVTRHDGKQVSLHHVFAGRRSAVQFIFVDCPTVCPLLGSLFGRVDRELGADAGQLVSISVNPEMDSPERIAGWLATFRASPRWVGLRVARADLSRLLAAFRQDAGPPDGHSMQVFLVDSAIRYVARTVEMPSAAMVAGQLRPGARLSEGTAGTGRERDPALILTGRDLYEGRGHLNATIGTDRLESHAARCSGCHGPAANGGGEGRTLVPALTRQSLMSLRNRRGGPASQYSVHTFCESLRTGVDPAGVSLSDVMPRYRIDGRACHQLWNFLTQ